MLRYDIEDGLQEHLKNKLKMDVQSVMASENILSHAIILVIVTRNLFYEFIYQKGNVYNKDGEKESETNIVMAIKEYMEEITIPNIEGEH